jgi:hypothetical protein
MDPSRSVIHVCYGVRSPNAATDHSILCGGALTVGVFPVRPTAPMTAILLFGIALFARDALLMLRVHVAAFLAVGLGADLGIMGST